MARKQRTGVVVSDAMTKTVVVQIERTVTHPLYHKVLRRRKQYQAHDETDLVRQGDRVLIEECRPISRRKKWRVVEILERHEVAELQPGEIAEPDIVPSSVPSSAAPSAPASAAPSVAESAPEPETAAVPDAPAEAVATADAADDAPSGEEAEGAAE